MKGGNNMSIIKTQGTKESVGAYMVYDENDECLFDEEGNNAWDTLEEAEEVKEIEKDAKNHIKNERKK